MHQAGLPDGVVNLYTVKEVAQAYLVDAVDAGKVNKISFTG